MPVVLFAVRHARNAANTGADILVPQVTSVVLFRRIINPSAIADISGTDRDGTFTKVWYEGLGKN